MKLKITISLLLFYAISIFSDNIISQRNQNTIHFALNDYKIENINANNTDYCRIRCIGLETRSNIGQAELPQYSFNWATGKGSLKGVRINKLVTDTLYLNRKIISQQPALSRNSSPSEFVIDRNYFNNNRLSYTPVRATSEFILRGVKGAIIDVQPFNYFPKKDMLVIIKDCEIELIENNPEPVTIHSPAFYKLMKETFTNYSDVIIPDTSRSTENYLIIAENSFHSTLSDFITFRQSKYNVNIISADLLGGNTMLIIDKIKELYSDPATRPTYLLLVGAFPLLPMCHATSSSSLGSPQNDLWYGAIDGDDYYSDIFVGRFSVGSGETDKLLNCINKTISFEQNAYCTNKSNLYIAAGGPYGDKATGPMNFIDSCYFSPAGYSNTKLYEDITPDITTARVTNLVNNGLNFLFYSGHGNWDHWKTSSFHNEDVYNLSNTTYPIVFSFACLTGDLNTLYGECFGEAWMNAEHGAASFIGATTETTWDPDDLFQRTIISAMFEKGFTTMQSAVAYGKVELDRQFPKWGLFYAETFNLCGDPALEIEPMLPVTIDQTIINNNPNMNKISINRKGGNLIIKSNLLQTEINSISVDIYSVTGRKLISKQSNKSTVILSGFENQISNGFYYGVVDFTYSNNSHQKQTFKVNKMD